MNISLFPMIPTKWTGNPVKPIKIRRCRPHHMYLNFVRGRTVAPGTLIATEKIFNRRPGRQTI
jgi:hypothetical protein